MCACCNWPAHTQTRTHMETHAKPSSKSSHIALLTKNSLLLLIPLSFSISPHTPFLSPPLCHSFIPAHTSAPLKTVQNSALLASGFSFLSFLFVVFFSSKGFCLWLQLGHEPRPQKPPPHCGDCWPKLLPYKWVNYDSDLRQPRRQADSRLDRKKVFRAFYAFH